MAQYWKPPWKVTEMSIPCIYHPFNDEVIEREREIHRYSHSAKMHISSSFPCLKSKIYLPNEHLLTFTVDQLPC